MLKKQGASAVPAKITFTASLSPIKAGSGETLGGVANAALTPVLTSGGATGTVATSNITGKTEAASASTLTQIIGDTAKVITDPTQAATTDCTISSALAVTGS
ncbi:MAG: hypothetical protein LBG27_02340 [Spirochaetaceae bacterium]|nr:hypothetical protein [Spirochaetaceae bacterium]